MVNAFVLIHIEGKDVKGIVQNLLSVDGITEVYPIAGEYDILAVIRVNDNAKLSHIVTDEIIHKPGIRHTKTLFALDCHAKINLAAAFGLK